MASVVPWSFSSLSAFETCPKRFYLTKITRQVPDPMSQAALEGNRVHKAMENAVNEGAVLPPSMKGHQPLVDKLRAAPGDKHAEMKFGLTRSYTPTAFFGKDVWFRGVIDLAIVTDTSAAVLDYKTGKVKEGGDQLKLFALAGFSMWPHVDVVHTNYLWLSAKTSTPRTFHRDEVGEIVDDFEPRVVRMQKAMEFDNWPARPSELCREWCPVGKRLCAHCGKD